MDQHEGTGNEDGDGAQDAATADDAAGGGTTEAASAATERGASADPRELLQEDLPAARRAYVVTWEQPADGSHPPARRRTQREQAGALADSHEELVDALRARLGSLSGEDRENAKAAADQLQRLVEAWRRVATLSAHGVASSEELRPDKVGCGRRYRRPRPASQGASRALPAKRRSGGGRPGGTGRGSR